MYVKITLGQTEFDTYSFSKTVHPCLVSSVRPSGLPHLVKVVSNDLPDPGPLQPDAPHVVVGDLNYFLQAEHAWVCGRGQLIHGHGTQPAHKIH